MLVDFVYFLKDFSYPLSPSSLFQTTYNVTCLSSSKLNSTDCTSCTKSMITGTFNHVMLTNIANRNESLTANITYKFEAVRSPHFTCILIFL